MSIYNKLRSFFSLFYPSKCTCCGKIIENKEPFCSECSKQIVPRRHVREIEVLGHKIVCVAAFDYDGAVRKAICEFKFNNKKFFAKKFAQSVFSCVMPEDKLSSFDCISAVPLSKKSYKERGYNQAELVARELGKMLKIPYIDTLNKVRENKAQHTLNAEERHKNVKGVYACIENINLKDKKIIFLDDIITTGNTLSECVLTLMGYGIKEAFCLTIADADCKKRSK